jgi:hypothetical protein
MYMSGHIRRKLRILDHCSSGSLTVMGLIMPPNVNRT